MSEFIKTNIFRSETEMPILKALELTVEGGSPQELVKFIEKYKNFISMGTAGVFAEKMLSPTFAMLTPPEAFREGRLCISEFFKAVEEEMEFLKSKNENNN